LTDGVTRLLMLISAPAGFGKTTLISEWHTSEAGRRFPLAWLALDDDDNDPTRFMTYVIAAAASLKPGFGESSLALLKSLHPSPPFCLRAWIWARAVNAPPDKRPSP
jgi:LuxR family maltose regulon positive regulatory protein